MIFVQPLYDNFLTTFSLILTLFSYFLSPLFLTNEKREKEIVTKVVSNDCSNITTHLLALR